MPDNGLVGLNANAALSNCPIIVLAPRYAQISRFGASLMLVDQSSRTFQIGGFARACPPAGSHGPLTVSPSDTAVDRRVRIGQDGPAISAVVVIDRSRKVFMERRRLIVR
jgi:hypothetical protein